MIERRELRFDRFEDVTEDVVRLLRGHRAVGSWSLAQVVYHIATAIRVTSLGRGPAVARPPERVESVLRRKFFRDGRIPSGLEIPATILDPPEGLDPLAESDGLRRAILMFRRSRGPYVNHPLLGPLGVEEWERFHRIHCAHHLSHVIPIETGDYPGDLVI